MKKFKCCLFLIMIAVTMAGQKKTFTLEELMPGGNNFASVQPENIRTTWWGDTPIELKQDGCYTINPKNGTHQLLFNLESINQWLNETGSINSCAGIQFPYPEEKLAFIFMRGKTILVDFEKGTIAWQMLTDPKATHVDWNKNSRNLAYCIGQNLYVQNAEGKVQAVSTDGSNDLVYGQSVHRDEFGIYKGTFWSPNGNQLAFYRMDQSMVPDYPQVNITTRIATTMPCKYPMAGEKSHHVTVGVFDVTTGKTIWLKTGAPEDRYFTNITWSPDGKSIYILELNRGQNHLQMVRYNAKNGEKEAIIYEEKHPKYVEPSSPLVFLPWDQNKMVFQSQRDGYNHLYLMDLKAPLYDDFKPAAQGGIYKEYAHVKQLTSGNWVVLNMLGFNVKDKTIIIQSNELSPISHNVFSVNINNGKRKALAPQTGVHTARLSASGNLLTDTYTSPEVPRSVNLIQTSNGKTINLLTATNPWEAFDTPEITCGTIKAADDSTDLYYRMVKPVHFDPNKKYPTIVYVYGGPHAHNVDASWNYKVRGWEIYMAQKGYLLFILDNRGSQYRGTAFENVTFRHLGETEMEDQMRGVAYLKSLPYVDSNRMGVHGWSFGGFMTTNLMLTYPETFKVGVAGGPVIDWNYYEVMYGERYMDTPQENPEGYKQSNLRLKAGNLKGRLQIIIGYNDPVCVPQHALSFLRAAADAQKQVDFFAYPGGEHNMFGRDQIHLHERITQYFEDFLK